MPPPCWNSWTSLPLGPETLSGSSLRPSLPAPGGSSGKGRWTEFESCLYFHLLSPGALLRPSRPDSSSAGWVGQGLGAGVCPHQVPLTCAEQDPRHLQYLADVSESNAYVVTQGRKLYGMPTDFGFCIKVRARAWPGRQWGRLSHPGSYLGLLSSAWDTQTPLPAPCPCPCPTETGDRRRRPGPKGR